MTVIAAIHINIYARGYSKGILNGKFCDCSNGQMPDHAVVIVGYGRDCKSNREYYIIRYFF